MDKSKAFLVGFIKAAGIEELVSKALQSQPQVQRAQFENMLTSGGITGGALGAGAGALTGYFAGQDKKNPENDHRIRDAIALGLGGAGLGAAGGVGAGALVGQQQYPLGGVNFGR